MLLTVREAARRLNLSPSTVYELINRGKLMCHRVGCGRGVLRISEDDLESYLASCLSQPVAKPSVAPRVKLKHLRA